MRLATTTGDFDRFCDTYLERIQNVYEAGFRYIDLSLYTPRENDELLISDNWRETVAQIRGYAEENGIAFVQAHGPGFNSMHSPEEFQRGVRLSTRAIQVCAALGIPNMVVHSGQNPALSKEEWFVQARDFFRQLFPAMEEYGVNVLHENTTNANIPWYYTKTGADMREFSEFVNHPRFHSCWDTGHANVDGAQYEHIMAMGDDLYAVHVNDNRGQGDEHLLPFMGTLNMDEVMHALMDVGYKGCFTLEVCYTLRPSRLWLGNRREFPADTRLLDASLELQQAMEKVFYRTGEYILKTYGLFEP